jgi:hypothetical protein
MSRAQPEITLVYSEGVERGFSAMTVISRGAATALPAKSATA